MEAAMAASAQTSERQTLLGHLGRWCQSWLKRRTALAELQHYSLPELERLGRDAGVGGNDLRVLAGKWPDSANLLTRRLVDLGLDATEIARADPQTMRDLQRVCTICASKGECEHDLARHADGSDWQEYCPNAATFDALRSDPQKKDPDEKAN
jgi:Family of unknown function (DUF6455)